MYFHFNDSSHWILLRARAHTEIRLTHAPPSILHSVGGSCTEQEVIACRKCAIICVKESKSNFAYRMSHTLSLSVRYVSVSTMYVWLTARPKTPFRFASMSTDFDIELFFMYYRVFIYSRYSFVRSLCALCLYFFIRYLCHFICFRYTHTWQSQCVYKSRHELQIAGRFHTNQLTVLHVKKKFTVSLSALSMFILYSSCCFFFLFALLRFVSVLCHSFSALFYFYFTFFCTNFSFAIRLENRTSPLAPMYWCVSSLPPNAHNGCQTGYIHHVVSARTGNHLGSQVISLPKQMAKLDFCSIECDFISQNRWKLFISPFLSREKC